MVRRESPTIWETQAHNSEPQPPRSLRRPGPPPHLLEQGDAQESPESWTTSIVIARGQPGCHHRLDSRPTHRSLPINLSRTETRTPGSLRRQPPATSHIKPTPRKNRANTDRTGCTPSHLPLAVTSPPRGRTHPQGRRLPSSSNEAHRTARRHRKKDTAASRALQYGSRTSPCTGHPPLPAERCREQQPQPPRPGPFRLTQAPLLAFRAIRAGVGARGSSGRALLLILLQSSHPGLPPTQRWQPQRNAPTGGQSRRVTSESPGASWGSTDDPPGSSPGPCLLVSFSGIHLPTKQQLQQNMPG